MPRRGHGGRRQREQRGQGSRSDTLGVAERSTRRYASAPAWRPCWARTFDVVDRDGATLELRGQVAVEEGRPSLGELQVGEGPLAGARRRGQP